MEEEELYVKCIIERLKEAGPYMFVTPDLILAHARPENGVRHPDFSIGIAPDGIEFQGRKGKAKGGFLSCSRRPV